MRGSAFAAKLPEVQGNVAQRTAALQRREQMIFDAVRRRDLPPIEWSVITSKSGPYTAKIHVSNDALRVGDQSDSFRVSLTHEMAQRAADDLDVVLPTPMLSDLIWSQAKVRLLPRPQLAWVKDGSMTKTYRMFDASRMIDKAIAGRGGLIADVGKDWVTTLRLWQPYKPPPHCKPGAIRSANYGWHGEGLPSKAATPAGGTLWQSIGLCHKITHVDYSQVVRLVRRDVTIYGPGLPVDGAIFDIEVVASSPQYAGLVSHEGPLPAMRHPAIREGCLSCPPDIVAGPGGEACPIECQPFPAPEPDPTAGDPVAIAGMGALGRAALVGVGVAAGYWAVSRLVA